MCRDIGLSHRLVLDELTPNAKGPLTDYREQFSRDQLRDYLEGSNAEMVSCIAADMEQARSLAEYRGVHVIRDPRDIIVSAYYSHKTSHPVNHFPDLKQHRRRLQNLNVEDGLLLEMDFSRDELFTLRDWDYQQHNVLELRMEDLTSDPYGGFLEVFQHFGLVTETEPTKFADEIRIVLKQARNRLSRRKAWPSMLRTTMDATGAIVLSNVYRQRFEAKSGGRKKGQVDANSHYRKGVHGDWINHFTPRVLEEFVRQYGQQVVKMGYETDISWTLDAEKRLRTRTSNADKSVVV